MDSRLWLYLLAASWLTSCATTGQISGGPPDTTPPQVVTIKSTPNQQTSFTKQEIVLFFDEFVTVKSPLKEIIVSPPLTYLPQIDHRGKRVKFSFNEDEVLKEDATYVINFGKSIQDFTAGNTLENYSFVFSTGDQIDSMEVTGSVVDAATGKAVSDMLVMLYDDTKDSIPYLEKPFYANRTNKEGQFTISNVRSDTFKLFGLSDANVNYLYDVPGELIAPYDSLIILDTSRQSVQVELRAFVEEVAPAIIDVDNKTLGVTKLLFNQEQPKVELEWVDGRPDYIVVDQEKDTVLLYYPTDTTLAGRELIVEGDTTALSGSRGKKTPSLRIRTISPPAAYPLAPNDTITISWSNPLVSFNLDSLMLQDTSGMRLPCSALLQKRQLQIIVDLPSTDAPYSLDILPGSVTDLFAQSNLDTSTVQLATATASNSGTLELDLRPLFSDTANYILTLSADQRILETLHTMDMTDSLYRMPYTPAGTYEVGLIRDVNRNRKQDGGQYLPRRRAEEEKSISLQPLKADWSVESEISWEQEEISESEEAEAPPASTEPRSPVKKSRK